MSGTTEKPYRELELVAELHGVSVGFLPVADLEPGELLEAVKAKTFAESKLSHHTDDAVYRYTIHLLNVPRDYPATVEMQMLTGISEEIHKAYSHLTHELVVVAPEQ